MNIKFSLKQIKDAYAKNKLRFITKAITISFAVLDFVTMPLFTYRVGFNFITIFLSAAFAVCFAIYVVFWGFLRLDLFIVPFILFVFYSIVSFAITKYSFSNLKTICLLYGLVFIIYESILNFRCAYIYLSSFIISTIVLGAFVFFSSFDAIISLSPERIGSAFGNLNSIGFIFAVGSFFCMFLLITFKKHIVALVIFLVYNLFFSFLSGSRGAIAISCISIIGWLFILFKGKAKIWFFASLIGLCAVFIAVLQIPSFSQLNSRIISALISILSGGTSGDSSSNIRIAMMGEGLSLFLQSPIFGNGVSSFAFLSNQLVYSHSNISEMLCNFGLVGSFIWIFPFLFGIKQELNTNKNKLLTVFGISLIAVGSFVSILFIHKFFLLSSAFCLGISGEASDISYISLNLKHIRNVQFSFNDNSYFSCKSKDKK